MTPLVDVVMVLLIFLMLAGSFGSRELFLPVRAGQGPVDVRPPRPHLEPEPVRLDVFVGDAGAGAAGFSATLGSDPTPIADPAALRAELARRRAQYLSAGTAPEAVQVVIHPAARTAWAPVVAAHEAALRAEFPRTGFALAR